jgi:translation initiation factor 1
MPKDERPTVYSTERGDLRKKRDVIKKRPTRSLPPNQQTAYLHRESKGRGGKTVTIVKNLVLSEADLKALAKKLKRACGSGGTVKEGDIIIQGKHREAIAKALRKMGYKVKIAGG